MTKTKQPIIPPTAKPTISLPRQYDRRRERFIQYLVEQKGWTAGAELGVWKGRTFLHLLATCPNLTMLGIDLWEAQPNNNGPENYIDWPHSENERYVREQAKQYGERSRIVKDWTFEAVKNVEDQSLDFVFIDADHSSESVRRDIQDWLPKLKNTGWVIGHDINWPTVYTVAEELLPGYIIGPDNAWARPKDPNATYWPFE